LYESTTTDSISDTPVGSLLVSTRLAAGLMHPAAPSSSRRNPYICKEQAAAAAAAAGAQLGTAQQCLQLQLLV
jgi:hypothetical protein